MKIFYRNYYRFNDNEFHEVSAEEMNHFNEEDFSMAYEGAASAVSLVKVKANCVYFEYSEWY